MALEQIDDAGRQEVVGALAARRAEVTTPAQLNPTPKRVQAAGAIHRGEVWSYAWTDRAWRRSGTDEVLVTRWVNDLLRHELAEKPAGELPSDRITLRLTPTGVTWWRRQDGRRTTTLQTTGAAL